MRVTEIAAVDPSSHVQRLVGLREPRLRKIWQQQLDICQPNFQGCLVPASLCVLASSHPGDSGKGQRSTAQSDFRLLMHEFVVQSIPSAGPILHNKPKVVTAPWHCRAHHPPEGRPVPTSQTSACGSAAEVWEEHLYRAATVHRENHPITEHSGT